MCSMLTKLKELYHYSNTLIFSKVYCIFATPPNNEPGVYAAKLCSQ